LDDQPGPARPIDDAKAQLMIARALEAAGPPLPMGRPAAPRRGRPLAVAAAVLIVASGSAWAAWRTGVLPRFSAPPPKPAPAEPGVGAPGAPEVGADADASRSATEGGAAKAPGASRAEPPLARSTGLERRARRAERLEDGAAERRAARRTEGPAARRGERRTGRGVTSAPPGPAVRAADWLAEANRWRRLGEWGRAESAYLQAVRSSAAPTTRQIAWVAVGELRLESLRRPREAVLAFRTALGLEGPLDAEARWGLARALRASGREEAARPVLRALVERYPERPEAERARAWLAR
jgi:tetratricopeptide (TPR) repeat protein